MFFPCNTDIQKLTDYVPILAIKNKVCSHTTYIWRKKVGVIAWLLNYYIIIKLLLLGVQYFRQIYNWHWVFKNNSFYLNKILKKLLDLKYH